MSQNYRSVSQSPGGAICRGIFLKKLISFSLVLALTISTLAFNPNAGPPALAETTESELTTTGNWNDTNDDGTYKYADFLWFINHTV